MADTMESFYGPELAASVRLPLPADYVPYRAMRAYYERDGKSERLEAVGHVGPRDLCGVRWNHGPLRFEKYLMDDEPPVADGPHRMILWQRLTRTDKPDGWWTGTKGMALRMTGLAVVEPGIGAAGTAAQEARWSSHGRRYAARWHKLRDSGTRELFPLTVEEYLSSYRHAEQDAFIKTFMPAVFRKKAAAHGELMKFWGSRRAGGDIDAGVCTLDIPEAGTMMHVGGFIRGEARKDAAAIGLLSHSFDGCRERGLRYMDFGFFWQPGDPSDWKGFSQFKIQFNVRFILYKPPLFRLA